jgi:hypothetical protein
MSQRRITVEEIVRIEQLRSAYRMVEQANHISEFDARSVSYEEQLDAFVRLVRPHLLETPSAPLCPAAPGAAASPIPTGGGNLITEEGVRDALAACHRDMMVGHFQFNAHEWATEIADYILRHAARADDKRAFHAAQKAVAA